LKRLVLTFTATTARGAGDLQSEVPGLAVER
jgi:hypothetical protein